MTKTAGVFWKAMPATLRRWLTRRLHTTFTVSAAGIIVNERGQVLLLNHVLRSTASGWGIPGGFIDLGEQPENALRREISEETGLQLEDISLVRCRTLYRHIEVIMTARGIGEPAVRSREISDLGWFTIDDLPEEMSPDQKRLVENLLKADK